MLEVKIAPAGISVLEVQIAHVMELGKKEKNQ